MDPLTPSKTTQTNAATIGSDHLLSPTQAASRLGISKTVLYTLLRQETLAHYRIGRLIRIKESDLASYFESHRVESKPSIRYGRYPAI